MRRQDISELHYITSITNVPSIQKNGILSNHNAIQLPHKSVAMQEIQDIRRNKQIPGARHLHSYACLYFDAHNPMLSKLRKQNNEICILRVNDVVIDLPGGIIADRNAASSYARFYSVSEGIRVLDKDLVYAIYWTHEDSFEGLDHKSKKCAEVLVPGKVAPQYIIGAYVANEVALKLFKDLKTRLPVVIKNGIFF